MAEKVLNTVDRIRHRLSGPVAGALLGAALASIALLILGLSISRWYEARLKAELSAQIADDASLRAQALSAAIYRRFALVEGLGAFTQVELDSPDFQKKFDIFSAELYGSAQGIRNIAIAPQGVMQYVYPLEGNQVVIGYNPLQDPRPDVRADVQKAIDTRAVVISGPHTLLQGGRGLILRQAVYQGASYWGLANLVFDLQPVLERAGLDGLDSDLDIALRDQSGQLIYGSADVFEKNPVFYRIMLEGDEWELASLPKGGWQAAVSSQLRVFQFAGLLIILLFSSLVYLTINRQSRLSMMVAERTKEISQINEQLIADIQERKRIEASLRASEERMAGLLDVAPDAVLAVNEDQQIVLFNKAAEAMFGYPSAEALGQPLALLLPECFVSSHARHVQSFVDGPLVNRSMDGRLSILGRRKDGSEFPAEASISKLTENGSKTLTAIVRDITHRKLADEALRQSHQRYEQLVNTVDGIVWEGDAQTFQYYFVSKQAEHILGYPVERWTAEPTFWVDHIHPEDRESSVNFCTMSTARKQDHVFEYRMIAADGRIVWLRDIVTVVVEDDQPVTLRGVMVDITESKRIEAELREREQHLEARVAQRTRELRLLLEISRNVASTLDQKLLLSLILEQLKTVVNFSALTVWILENEDEFVVFDFQGPLPREKGLRRWVQPDDHRAVLDLTQNLEPVIIPNVRADTGLARVWRESMLEMLGEIPGFVCSWMGIPLVLKNRVTGLLTFNHDQVDYYTPQHAELALALARHAAVAIENARLFQTVQRGAEQFRAISEMGQRITSILDVDELLSQTVHLIRDTFGYYHAHIGLIEGDLVLLPASAGVWENEPDCSYCSTLNLQVGQDAICAIVAFSGEPLVVPDISQEPRYLHPLKAIGSGVVVPLKVKGQVIGLLDVESKQINAFDESDLAVLQSLANQVAVAIENARLYEQAQRLAALQERQKLARELHDSVSQALYGLALGTRTARTLLDRDPAKAAEPLDYCLSLAEAGLAEMRALIFELRPESLETEGLVAALSKQAAAVQARYNVKVETEFCVEPQVSLATKEALYRIAQEALNNTVKHAQASCLEMTLRCGKRELILEVEDNGTGFDPQGEFPGHLGLKSMRERAERLGGGLTIKSLAGRGTKVQARIPLDLVKV